MTTESFIRILGELKKVTYQLRHTSLSHYHTMHAGKLRKLTNELEDITKMFEGHKEDD